MQIITQIKDQSNKIVKGKQDMYAKQEMKAISLGRKIFHKYGYNPVEIHNFNDKVFKNTVFHEGTDHGIDEVIYIDDIPTEDPLNLKLLSKPRFDDQCYTIDYKSNNFSDNNSIYVKIMANHAFRFYEKEIEVNGVMVNTIDHYYKLSKKREESKLRKNKIKNDLPSLFEKRYSNKYLLDHSNKTDYFMYLKYPDESYAVNYHLKKAYIVLGESLRHQIIDIINDILHLESNTQIKLSDTFLNHKISEAFSISKKYKYQPLESGIELFKSKNDIILKIPEDNLIDYIKFNNEFNIISHHLN
ncbi:MAG: hypothetical protein NKF70_03980 [Methanobacterium sp. ERen5]|nr:MAG: hypothetical protein NKF70_03980 [Methanobacterium sp. ERen5]